MKKPGLVGNKRSLQVLFKEVLANITEEQATLLMDGHRSGCRNIVVIMGESSFGHTKQTAHCTFLTEDQSWRGLPEPVPGVQ